MIATQSQEIREDEDALEECADCGASTAQGTPDPHECATRIEEATSATAQLAAPRPRPRPRSEIVVDVRPELLEGAFLVIVLHPDGEAFEECCANVQEVAKYLRGLDAGAFPNELVWPKGWEGWR